MLFEILYNDRIYRHKILNLESQFEYNGDDNIKNKIIPCFESCWQRKKYRSVKQTLTDR